ncbi:hypothetical protein L7F22_032183 [Adiantum nelumboides]|nr:hypothetical protein [Adiantum nelumboides]
MAEASVVVHPWCTAWWLYRAHGYLQGLSFAIIAVKYITKDQNFSTNKTLGKQQWLGLDGLLLALICFCSIVVVTGMRDNLIIHSTTGVGDHVHEQRRQEEEDDEAKEAGQSRDSSRSTFRQGLEWVLTAMVVFMQLGIVLTFIRRPSIAGHLKLGPTTRMVVHITKEDWRRGFVD